MKRTFCDRCKAEMAEYWIVAVTYVYYGRRQEAPTLELCEACYAGRRSPTLETTDTPPLETTSMISTKRTDQQQHDGSERSDTLGSNPSG
jgi:hypothetical protein